MKDTSKKSTEKETFVVKKEYIKFFDILTNDDLAGAIRAVFKYENDGILPEEGELSTAANLLFTVMKTDIDRFSENYDRRCDTSSENGKKGGRPKKETSETGEAKDEENLNNLKKPKSELGFESKPKKADNDNDNENENDNDFINSYCKKNIGSYSPEYSTSVPGFSTSVPFDKLTPEAREQALQGLPPDIQERIRKRLNGEKVDDG